MSRVEIRALEPLGDMAVAGALFGLIKQWGMGAKY